MLTADSEPELENLEGLEDYLHFQMQYSVPLPAYVLYNFIVLMKSDVDRLKTWKNGTFLASAYGNSRAIVRFGKNKNIIDIYVAGSVKTEYFSYIRKNIEFLQEKMDLNFDEFIEYRVEDKKTFLELNRLIKMLRKGKSEEYAEEIDRDVDIIDVLASMAPDDVINKLRLVLKENEHELRRLRERDLYTIDIRNLLLNISDDQKKILRNIHILEHSIENTVKYSGEQLCAINDIFIKLKESKDPEILHIAETVLEEIKKVNSKSLSVYLIKFVGIAGSVAKIAPYIERLVNVFLP
jgi:hypothetical protein